MSVRYYLSDGKGQPAGRVLGFKPGSWIKVVNPDASELDALASEHGLDRGHLDDALDEDEMPRVEREDKITYFYTRFPFIGNRGEIDTTCILMIKGKNFVCTISGREFDKVEQMTDDPKTITSDPGPFIVKVTAQVVSEFERKLNLISRDVKAVRGRLRRQAVRNRDFIKFVEIEDEINEFLSALKPTGIVLQRLATNNSLKLSGKDSDKLDDLILAVDQSTEECMSTLKSVVNIRSAHATIMTNNLNSVMKTLTVATLALAVPTLVASVYGMNIELPYQGSPLAFVVLTVGSLGVVCAMLIYFTIKKWI